MGSHYTSQQYTINYTSNAITTLYSQATEKSDVLFSPHCINDTISNELKHITREIFKDTYQDTTNVHTRSLPRYILTMPITNFNIDQIRREFHRPRTHSRNEESRIMDKLSL